MGIPYSRQINAAFDQVTPLVAAGFRVLQTTKNISILLAAIQVLTVLLLFLILLALLALLISINPHLEGERDSLVTPALEWGCANIRAAGRGVIALGWLVLVGGMAGGGLGIWWTAKEGRGEEALVDDDGGVEGKEGRSGDELSGEDVEAIKEGKSSQ
jgi:hypothetical protein